MDRYLINGFDQMTEGNPFFSFVITLSGHGPYGEDNPSYQAHAEAAQTAAQRTDGNYVYAVAGAMETDQFIGELVDSLTQANLLEDTVLIFYADHYNYYMMDDALNMDIKGVDNMNMLQHTDFFIWSADLEATQVDKVTSSVDVLPTIANLFWAGHLRRLPGGPRRPGGPGGIRLLLRRQLVRWGDLLVQPGRRHRRPGPVCGDHQTHHPEQLGAGGGLLPQPGIAPSHT